ncbi:MAG: DUF6809 family protein [Christensenellales bacterium]
MKSFIRALYFGNVDPQAKGFDRHSAYGKAMDAVAKNEGILTGVLTGNEKEVFLDYVSAWSEVLGITAAETFTDGFRLGASFTLDAFLNTDSDFKDIQEA